MKIWSLLDAFRQDVSALYDGMQQFLEVHEELAGCASDPELVRRLRRHLKQTEQQVTNLDRIAEMLSEQDLPVTSHAARGIAREVRDAVDAAQTNHVRDWIITTAADTLLHAEITRYTSLIAMARQFGAARSGGGNAPAEPRAGRADAPRPGAARAPGAPGCRPVARRNRAGVTQEKRRPVCAQRPEWLTIPAASGSKEDTGEAARLANGKGER